MTWTTLSFAYGSVLTSAKMAQLQDNFGYGTGSVAPNFASGVTGTTGNFSGKVNGQTLVISGGGASEAGALYSDSNWGMIFQAKQAAPAAADFMWSNSAGAERMRLDGNTLTIAGGQIKFPATQNASSDANTLDDYEEGTWTPTVPTTTGYTTQYGKYVKIGGKVTISGFVETLAQASQLQSSIGGFPFASSSSGNTYSSASFSISYMQFTGANALFVYGVMAGNSQTSMQLRGMTASGTSDAAQAIFSNGMRCGFGGSYTVF